MHFNRHIPALIVLLLFLCLGFSYSLATPPLEAGDESRHYAVVKFMSEEGRLINQHTDHEHKHHWNHEGNQPPLYYVLVAGAVGWLDNDDWSQVFWYNPHTTVGVPLREDNKNNLIHPPHEPWTGYVLASQLIRWLSLAMAAVTVWTSYLIALRLFRGNHWWAVGSMAVTAFTPMFIFISASVNNDNLVIMLVTLALGWLVWSVQPSPDGFPKPFGASRTSIIGLGVLIGLGGLSKLYAFGLLPLAGVIILWLCWLRKADRFSQHVRSNGIREVLGWGLWLGGTVFVVAGWFYLRNAWLYDGDLLAIQSMRDEAGVRDTPLTLNRLWIELEGFRIAYWGLFGGVNILASPWIYRVLDGLSLIAGVGMLGYGGCWVYQNLRSTGSGNPKSPTEPVNDGQRETSLIHLPTLAVLGGWLMIMVAGFIVWNLTQPAMQGRLFYPAISGISAFFIFGLTWWLPNRVQKLAIGLVCGALFLFAALSPTLYIAPAYAKTALLKLDQLPTDIEPLDLVHDGTMRLLGYRLPVDTIRPAQEIPLTLYWQVLEPTPIDYSVFIHLWGRDRWVVGQLDSYPSGGDWPTTLLQPGDIVQGAYRIAVTPTAEFEHAPTRLEIAVGLYNYFEAGRSGKPIVNSTGNEVEARIASLRLVPWTWPEPKPLADLPAPVNFFDQATLLNAELATDRSVITLTWRAESYFDRDYTVFIQAWQAGDEQPFAGFDQPPIYGQYPTSLWRPDDVIVDAHALDPAVVGRNDVYLLLGLYDPNSGERLPAFGPDGPLDDYAVRVGVK